MKVQRNKQRSTVKICSFPNCELPGTGNCFNCIDVQYCSKEHQQRDWISHGHRCQIFERKIVEVQQDGDKRKLVPIAASTDIQPGRQIKSESPAVVFPNVDYCSTEFTDEYTLHFFTEYEPPLVYRPTKPQVCFGCYQSKVNGLEFQCSRCGIPLCSAECEDSLDHQSECILLQGQNTFSGTSLSHPTVRYMYMDIATLRIILLKLKNKKLFYQVMNLAQDSRIERYRRGREFLASFKANQVSDLLPISSQYAEDSMIVDAYLIALVMGHVNLHAHPTYKCIYPFISSLSHSCVPNLGYIGATFKAKDTLTIVTSLPISIGTTLTIDLLPKPFMGRLERQELLRRKAVIRCSCPRCTSSTDLGTFANAVKCPRCIPGYLLPQSMPRLDWKCINCEQFIDFTSIYEVLAKAAKELKAIVTCCDPRPTDFKRFQCSWELKLHPNHYIILSSTREEATMIGEFILNGAAALKSVFSLDDVNAQRYKQMRNACATILRFLDASRPGHTLARGKILRQYFFMDFVYGIWELRRERIGVKKFLIRLKKGVAVLRESCSILETYYGTNAPKKLYNKQLLLFLEHLETIPLFITSKSNRMTVRKILAPIVSGMLRLNLQNEQLLNLSLS